MDALQLLDDHCRRGATLQDERISTARRRNRFSETYTVADASGTVLARLERVRERDHDTCARVTDGVTQCNGTTTQRDVSFLSTDKRRKGNAPVDVDLCRVNAQHLFGDANDDGESFVDFKESNVARRQPCSLQSQRQCDRGGRGEVDGIQTSVGIG